eukprot:scaffold74742_cov29-Tisochrysis_lutea.AAC.4
MSRARVPKELQLRSLCHWRLHRYPASHAARRCGTISETGGSKIPMSTTVAHCPLSGSRRAVVANAW